MSDQPGPRPDHELTDATTVFRAQRFSDPAISAPQPEPDWVAATPPIGIPLDPIRAASAYSDQYVNDVPAPSYRPSVPQTPYPDLSTSALLRQLKPPPSSGWRRALYLASGKLINVGEGPRAIQRNNLVAQVNRPLQGCYRIAVMSLKGGVGKTTITATLGGTFASIRGDRVIAVDANPDRGTLNQKVPLETPATVRHLLRGAEGIERYTDVRGYTSQGPSRLEVLASESDPAVSQAFSAEDYDRTLAVLERFYNLVLTDCGTGLLHSAMSSVLSKADTLIVVSSGSVDGARSASATLDWLDAHGHQDLVRSSVCVINAVRPRSGKVDLQKVVDHFSRRCRAVRLVPFDPHLEEGAEIELARLRPKTRAALVELAAVVSDGFPAEVPDERFG
ncbi:MinD/ParA family ATP-binding protein [Candidatus Mycolicibacterium alkanivorans]|uniref:MinD/ParA family protein n=1 Tax=Candidatus Mycolicibacterium alkanivorans TaxID=2954114 RepID=A0ABS9YQK6_9MYCO|nr:MinD/ParA family protein [Candidatus Mycolicibacterium alkanivorans]MCI4673559.1 MinD/ParA family protein [Candidatus Mycolicibacterium alkanivorans]